MKTLKIILKLLVKCPNGNKYYFTVKAIDDILKYSLTYDEKQFNIQNMQLKLSLPENFNNNKEDIIKEIYIAFNSGIYSQILRII